MRTASRAAILACVLLGLPATAPHADAQSPPPVQFQSTPVAFDVAAMSPDDDIAVISDLVVADLDRDGRSDIAVAWFISDYDDFASNRRRVSIFYGSPSGALERGADIDLFAPDPNGLVELAVFRNGTASMAVGDFDGDGDADLAVTAYFGDEIWFLENEGARQFRGHLRFPFFFNSAGNFQTPPEAAAADFDGDGRDDLVYVADPIQHIFGLPILFWSTRGTIDAMERVEWGATDPGAFAAWTRSLGVADFNGDGRPDLCYAGLSDVTSDSPPRMVFWFSLDAFTGVFRSSIVAPPWTISDVAAVACDGLCRPGLLCADRNGSRVGFWTNACAGQPTVQYQGSMSGFAGVSTDRGMSLAVGDLNGDGSPDVVTKQRFGSNSVTNKIEIGLSSAGGLAWTRLDTATINSGGFAEADVFSILRPRGLAIGDVLGDDRPEIVAGFSAQPGNESARRLRIAIWRGGCAADISGDGRTDLVDLSMLLTAFECQGGTAYNPAADLDHNGCVELSDLARLLADFGCGAGG